MMRVDYKAFGKRLREYRLARHLTQEQLGELVGVSYQHIGMLERGKRSPSMEMLISLCYVLDCTCDSLLTDSLPEQTIYMLRQRPRRLRNTLTNWVLADQRMNHPRRITPWICICFLPSLSPRLTKSFQSIPECEKAARRFRSKSRHAAS